MICIDLFCGLGGWADGFLAEGWDVIGFDIERHRYPKTIPVEGPKGFGGTWFHNAETGRGNPNRNRRTKGAVIDGEWDQYPGQLVLQDVLTLHGSQFRNAHCIVASPPCQAYSYRAMPWKRAKALPPPSNELFDACFRIQREACAAAGRHIPLVVENVRGAQKWVGPASWRFGSFYLWGNVPALMPITLIERMKYQCSASARLWKDRDIPRLNQGHAPLAEQSIKNGADWVGSGDDCSLQRRFSSRSIARKAASAQIAKIPFPLAQHIAQVFKP
jgi:hypothetical protein